VLISAVAGSNVAVATYVTKINNVVPLGTSGIQSKPTQAHEATSVTVLRNTTVIFNKDTDKVLVINPIVPDFLKDEKLELESKAKRALVAFALSDGKISKQEAKDLKTYAAGVTLLELGYKEYKTGIDAFTMNQMYNEQYGVDIGNFIGIGSLKVGRKVSTNINVINRTPARASNIGCNCFTAGTKVLTDEGEKNIEDIEVGDRVLAKDENNPDGELAYKEVGEQIIETTDNHPFWVQGKGWLFADELQVGDKLQKADGSNLTIDKVEFVKLDEPVTVYNFTVADYHTYYVTDLGIWVHNTECDLSPKTLATMGRTNTGNAGLEGGYISKSTAQLTAVEFVGKGYSKGTASNGYTTYVSSDGRYVARYGYKKDGSLELNLEDTQTGGNFHIKVQ
jgi:hypothetical protein